MFKVGRGRISGRSSLRNAVSASKGSTPTRGSHNMPRVVITHAVEDIDRWLQGKTKRAADIESGSGSNVTDYVARDGSNNIAVTADVSDPAALQGILASPPPRSWPRWRRTASSSRSQPTSRPRTPRMPALPAFAHHGSPLAHPRKVIMAAKPPDFPRQCAWQESNLRPCAPEAHALSPELQARGAQSTDGPLALRAR